jgi:hypothetical protein
MAFDGVISFQGKDHITAPQIGRLIAGVAGSVRGILQTQNQIKAAMQTANRVRIDTGDVLFDARMVTNEEPFELNVANGRAGYKRNDLVVLKYSKQVGGVEKFTCEVIQGTPTNQGNPVDPTYVKGDILSGSTTACMPLYRLPINGITVGEPVSLLPTIKVLGEEKEDTSKHWTTLQDDGACRVRYCVRGGMMYLDCYLAAGYPRRTTTAQMPKELLPAIEGYYPLGTQDGNNTAKVWVGSVDSNDGHIYLYNYSSGYATGIIPLLPKSME